MKLVIVYLIKGKAEKLQQKLAKEVGPKFGEHHLIKNPLPAHVTLKSPFEIENSKKIEQVLKDFVKKQRQGDVKIRGFGNFRRFVAFMNTKFSWRARKIQKNLLKEVKKLNIPLHEFDINFKPHATIAYGNTKETFDKIWNYLMKLDKPKFDLKFDNITLLKKTRGKWKIYKEFKLK
jgi:2'-5' RNA ligase